MKQWNFHFQKNIFNLQEIKKYIKLMNSINKKEMRFTEVRNKSPYFINLISTFPEI